MIVGSLLLILVAVGLLVAGVLSGSNVLIIASIVATVIAAVILILGVRQSASDEDEYDGGDADESGGSTLGRGPSAGDGATRTPGKPGRSKGAADETGSPERGGTMVGAGIPSQGRERDQADASEAAESVADEDDPPGEPAAQATSPSNAARIALMTSEVLVVDGRPRYHVGGCLHLAGRESEPLPVGEASGLGFTPCGLCKPDAVLLAEGRPV